MGYTLLCAQEKAAAAREVAARFAALREVLLQRDPAGLTPLLETRVIEASALTMEHKASEAELAAQAALLELNQLRGEPSGASWQVAREELSFRASEGLDTLVAMARTNNFELRVRAAELAQQGFRVTLARQERYPAISVGPTYTRGNPAENEQTIGVGVSLPLPLWNRNSANIESASARRMQAQTSLAVAGRDVERQVIEAGAGLRNQAPGNGPVAGGGGGTFSRGGGIGGPPLPPRRRAGPTSMSSCRSNTWRRWKAFLTRSGTRLQRPKNWKRSRD